MFSKHKIIVWIYILCLKCIYEYLILVFLFLFSFDLQNIKKLFRLFKNLCNKVRVMTSKKTRYNIHKYLNK